MGSGEFSAQRRWRSAVAVVAVIVVAALALPVLAADPSASPGARATPGVAPFATPQRSVPSASAEPAEPAESADPAETDEDNGGGGKPDKADKTNKADKTPEVAITLSGTVATATDAKGRSTFSLSSGGKTYELDAGPPWFWGANNPLAKFAGKSVTITGETHVGSTEVDVATVDGTAIRAPGKPPWAGGWKVVGEKHPGWSQAKADKFKAKFGGCWPPGHCKQPESTSPTSAPPGD
jgi:hypothetical protein